jgi:hypothetical protein
MTDTTRSSMPSDRLGDERRRPSAIIDLPATEVEARASHSAANDPAANDKDAIFPQQEESASSKPAGRGPPPKAGIRRGALWLVVGAVAAGAAGIIVGGIWLARFGPQGEPPSALGPRLEAIQSELRQLTGRPAPTATDPSQLSDLSKRLATAEEVLKRLDNLANRTGTSEQTAQPFKELSSRIGAMEQSLGAIEEISARISKLETAVAAGRAGTGDADLGGRVAAAEAKLDQQFATLARRLDEIDVRLAETVKRSVSNEMAVDTQASAAVDRAVRLAVLAAALNTQVERGQPFAAELAAIKAVVTDQSQLAPLESLAASGVPSAAVLAGELSSLMPAMLAATTSNAADDTVLGRLQNSAERLVRIRPVNATAGDGPRSVLALIETKAAQGDLGGAVTEFAKVPPSVRAAATAWIRKVEARIAAVEASRQLTARALAGLAKSAP